MSIEYFPPPAASVAASPTVTGPDAFGAAAVVGASGKYSDGAHDHGLPALPTYPTGPTTPLALSTATKFQSPGGIASIIANQSTGLSTTEKQIVGATLPANFLTAGTVIEFKASCKITVAASATAITFRIRIGTTTLTGNIPASIAPLLTIGAVDEFWLEGFATVRTTGAGGTITGDLRLTVQTTNNPFVIAGGYLTTTDGTTVVVDTTASKIIELTMQLANATNTAIAYQGYITVIKM